MGSPIATNLLKAGYQLRVYNRTEQKAASVIAAGAKWVDSPTGVIEPGGIVFTMLADDAAVESTAVDNPDFLDRFAGGGIHISMSTIAPRTARYLAEQHAKKGVAYLAAPVIGRPDRAAAGSLFILLAGESKAKQAVEPLLKNLGQRIFDFGEKPWQVSTPGVAQARCLRYLACGRRSSHLLNFANFDATAIRESRASFAKFQGFA
jgi:3-hydroxyisobutyrate dehydrogenase-like beta-hydroxyacid dehydrogenase